MHPDLNNYFKYSVIITDKNDGQNYKNKTQFVINYKPLTLGELTTNKLYKLVGDNKNTASLLESSDDTSVIIHTEVS